MSLLASGVLHAGWFWMAPPLLAIGAAGWAVQKVDLGNEARGLFGPLRIHQSIGDKRSALALDFTDGTVISSVRSMIRVTPFSRIEAVRLRGSAEAEWIVAGKYPGALPAAFNEAQELWLDLRLHETVLSVRVFHADAHRTQIGRFLGRYRARKWLLRLCAAAEAGQPSNSWGVARAAAS